MPVSRPNQGDALLTDTGVTGANKNTLALPGTGRDLVPFFTPGTTQLNHEVRVDETTRAPAVVVAPGPQQPLAAARAFVSITLDENRAKRNSERLLLRGRPHAGAASLQKPREAARGRVRPHAASGGVCGRVRPLEGSEGSLSIGYPLSPL